MMARFEVPGEPRGKGRPRFARMGKGVRAYTDEKTASFENRILSCYLEQIGAPATPPEDQLHVFVVAWFGVPKSYPKAMHKAAADGVMQPVTKKPDVDNILKSVLDALNGVAWKDDAQVYYAVVHKVYGTRPRLDVTLAYGPALP